MSVVCTSVKTMEGTSWTLSSDLFVLKVVVERHACIYDFIMGVKLVVGNSGTVKFSDNLCFGVRLPLAKILQLDCGLHDWMLIFCWKLND